LFAFVFIQKNEYQESKQKFESSENILVCDHFELHRHLLHYIEDTP